MSLERGMDTHWAKGTLSCPTGHLRSPAGLLDVFCRAGFHGTFRESDQRVSLGLICNNLQELTQGPTRRFLTCLPEDTCHRTFEPPSGFFPLWSQPSKPLTYAFFPDKTSFIHTVTDASHCPQRRILLFPHCCEGKGFRRCGS